MYFHHENCLKYLINFDVYVKNINALIFVFLEWTIDAILAYSDVNF